MRKTAFACTLLASAGISGLHCSDQSQSLADEPGNPSNNGGQGSADGSVQSHDSSTSSKDGGATTDSGEYQIGTQPDASRPPAGSCTLATPAFCETFETGTPGGRGAGVDPSRIGIARSTQAANAPQGEFNLWYPATARGCAGTTSVVPPNDYFLCPVATGGQHLRQAYDDSGSFTVQSLSLRQPFDFAGRTGKIVFDTDAWFTYGHGAWLEFWIVDQAIPLPYHESPGAMAFPRNGVGVELRSDACSTNATSNRPSTMHVFKDYAITRSYTSFTGNKCFTTERLVMNHIEVEISTNSIEFFATDKGQTGTRFSVGRIDNLGLNFTRGYVHIQHSHYNAAKDNNQPSETHIYDNIGFDGPLLVKPRYYDVPDSLTAKGSGRNVGYGVTNGASKSFTLPGVDITGAQAATLNLNAVNFLTPSMSLQYRLNGGAWRTYAPPFKESSDSWRAISAPITVTDLVAGNNTLEIKVPGSNEFTTVANVDLQVIPGVP